MPSADILQNVDSRAVWKKILNNH